MDTNIEILEFLDQIDYCLSLKFKETWRYRFSTHFIEIFQEKVLKSLQTQRPLKLSTLVSAYTKKHKYPIKEVRNFFDLVSIEDYYPLVYEDPKYFAMKKESKP